jgi:hypothetical protein
VLVPPERGGQIGLVGSDPVAGQPVAAAAAPRAPFLAVERVLVDTDAVARLGHLDGIM